MDISLNQGGSVDLYVVFATLFTLTAALIVHLKESRFHKKETERIFEAIDMERERLEKYLTDRINNTISFERKKIAEMQRYIEFGKLSRGIIHDLMNPLNAISLSLEEKDEEFKKTMQSTIDASNRLKNYLNNVRKIMPKDNLSYVTENNTDTCAVGEEIEAIFDILKYRLKTLGIRAISDYPQKMTIHVNPLRLNQVLFNLVVNAIDAHENSNRTKKIVGIECYEDPDEYELIVYDNASGIAANKEITVFQESFTTKSDGTGIGLMTVRDIVENEFHGQIFFQTERGIGCAFIIKIPRKLEVDPRSKVDPTNRVEVDPASISLGINRG